MSQPFNVRSEILGAIAKTNDENLKMILLLMLGVLEEICSKIDTVISDEKTLKEMVLNGHTDQHHAHHDWIAQRIAHQGRCEWANKEIAKQADAAAAKKGAIKTFLNTAVQQITLVAITAIAAAAGMAHYMNP